MTIRNYILFIFLFFILSPAQQNDRLNFVLLTDLHVSPGEISEKNLHRVIEEINNLDIDLVVISGDISNTGSNAELHAVKKALDLLKKPYSIIPGNHETNWSETAAKRFYDIWGDDKFIIEKNNFILVGYNTGPYMKMGDGHIKKEDIVWLEKVLSKKMKDSKTLISIGHYPLSDGLDNWFEVTKILKKHKTIAHFCGHGHKLQLMNFDGIPGVMGRSLVLGRDTIPGYNIVSISADSVFVTEKNYNKPAVKPFIKFAQSEDNNLKSIDSNLLPDYSINLKFPQIRQEYILSDNSSIFTGISFISDSLILYGTSAGRLNLYNIKQNKMLWSNQFTAPVYSTPVCAAGVIVFGDVTGSLYGLNQYTGNKIWEIKGESPVLSQAVIKDNFVYTGSGSKAFYKINLFTGEIIWTFNQINGAVQSPAAISGDNIVFGAWDTHLYCISATTGELNWKWNNGKTNILYSPGNVTPVISGNKVFIVAPDRYMTAINLTNGKTIWRTNKHKVRESIGISPDGSEVYAKLMNDSLVAVSALPDTVKTLWSVDAGIGYDHNPCPIATTDDFVFGATKNGLLVAVNRKTRLPEWSQKIENSSITMILPAGNNSVWVSSMNGKIVKIKY